MPRHEFTSNMQWTRAQIKAVAERRAAELGIILKARTKAELASFLVYHGDPARRITKENG